MALDEKKKLKAYVDAKHNMTLEELKTACKEEERACSVARGQAAHHDAVLAGYKQALKERQ
jgi:hypothetical protein